jgi:hypothetical protein
MRDTFEKVMVGALLWMVFLATVLVVTFLVKMP